jgi:hypothetical protein
VDLLNWIGRDSQDADDGNLTFVLQQEFYADYGAASNNAEDFGGIINFLVR